MRRYLKPMLTVAVAAAAALVVMGSGAPFDGAPAAKAKTVVCRTTTTSDIETARVKPRTFLPTLPTIPPVQIPCTIPVPPALGDVPAKLSEIRARIVNVLAPTTTTSTTNAPLPCGPGGPPEHCTTLPSCTGAGYDWVINGDTGYCADLSG